MSRAPELFDNARGLYFAPIRHHSPACAWHLRALIDEVRPRQVLIECPIDFDPLIPVLLDAATRPPVAIVALASVGDDEQRRISYYPFSSHAPEYVALRAGHALGARLGFIDLPSAARLGVANEERPAVNTLSFADERRLDANTYTQALCRRTGCRDQNELWDHLFETRLGTNDWRAFFSTVGAYCSSIRATVSDAEMAADGTDARERHMAARIGEALGRDGPIVVVTGGFHTPALIEHGAAPPKTAGARNASSAPGSARAYVIRYSFEELDRLNGYAAGLPSPLHYERLWQAAGEEGRGGSRIWRSVAAETLTEFAAHLRRERPSLTPSLPALANALAHATQLAELRGRPGPTRQDILDAAQSCFVKEEVGFGLSPILLELRGFLTGNALGDVPASAGSPPLVETVRAVAKRLGVDLDFTSRRKRELDIYRSERHQQVSRFLHAMTFIGTELGVRISGPDFLHSIAEDLLYEVWTIAWSPMVEARLIDLSPLGDTLEAVAGRLLQQRIETIREDANGSGASSVAIQLLFTVCQIGLQDRAGDLWPIIEGDIAADADLASVARSLSALFLLWRARDVLGLVGSADAERLVGVAYRRALHLLADIRDTKEERYRDVLAGLATLREVVSSARGEVAAIDAGLFNDAIERRLDDSLPPALAGAMAALAYLAGVRGTDILLERIRGHLQGAYLSAAENVAALNGMLTIAPELVWRVPELLAEIDALVADIDEARFVEQLPHLRLAFSALNPREIDEIAARLAVRHDADAGALQAPVTYGISEAELQANLALGEKVRASLAADGLADWTTAGRESRDNA